MSVEKFIVRKETSPFTVLPNNVLQHLTDAEALGLWCYLSSLPPQWEFYKEQLREHFNIGRDKIDRLINVLQSHSLIDMRIVRNERGQFAHFDIHVRNGEDFTISNENKELNENAHPLTDLPATVNQSLVNSSYKRNNKKQTNKKEISKNLCASDDARESFNRFWNIYPKKKDKKRAFKVWCTENLVEKENTIIDKLTNQIRHEAQWKSAQFIPYPERYLRGERWEDEITQAKEHPVTQSIRDLKEKSPAFRDFLKLN